MGGIYKPCATSVTIEQIKFDSLIEGSTYKALRLFFSKEEIKVHYKLPLYEKTNRFRALAWKVDFYVPHLGIAIESKGFLGGIENREWWIKMHILERENPSILDSLIVVSNTPGQKTWDNKTTIGIEKLKSVITKLIAEA